MRKQGRLESQHSKCACDREREKEKKKERARAREREQCHILITDRWLQAMSKDVMRQKIGKNREKKREGVCQEIHGGCRVPLGSRR